MRHAVIILLALLSIGLLLAALAPAQERAEGALMQYRLDQLEKRVETMLAEHSRLTMLLVANLASVVVSLGVYVATHLRRRNGRGNER